MIENDLARGLQRGNKGLHVLLSRNQAGPGRTVKQEQEEISHNYLQTFIFPSVLPPRLALVGALKASGLEMEVGAILCVLHREGGLILCIARQLEK